MRFLKITNHNGLSAYNAEGVMSVVPGEGEDRDVKGCLATMADGSRVPFDMSVEQFLKSIGADRGEILTMQGLYDKWHEEASQLRLVEASLRMYGNTTRADVVYEKVAILEGCMRDIADAQGKL